MVLSPDDCVARRPKMLTYKRMLRFLTSSRLALERNSSFFKVSSSNFTVFPSLFKHAGAAAEISDRVHNEPKYDSPADKETGHDAPLLHGDASQEPLLEQSLNP